MRKVTHILIFAFSAMLLSACTRSASTVPVVLETEDPLESIFSTIATQTALAGGDHSPELQTTLTLPPTTTSLFGNTATMASSSTSIPTASTTPAPTHDLELPSSYTLHAGEWPYCLARRFDIDIDALLAANNLNANQADELPVGYKMNIPQSAPGFNGERTRRPHPTTYVATGSDSFYSIACAFGDVWPEHIAEANGMEVDDEISGGQQLHIP